MSKSTNQRENRPIWNNVKRVNHLNQFVSSAILTRSGKIPINTARASGTNNVNTARQNVSTARQNSSSEAVPSRTARKVSTLILLGAKQLVLLGEMQKLLLRPHQVVLGDQKDDLQRALKNKGIVDSGCSRHMTGNKSYLVDYLDYNGGPVAFGGSKCQITGKVSSSWLSLLE
ncbi:hypothetical protein Tco_0170072 [Tanacetum coccineum]